jgi:hypothetical protein
MISSSSVLRANGKGACRGPLTTSEQGLMALSWQLVRSQHVRGTAETRASIARELASKEGGARDKVVTVVHGIDKANTLDLK